MLDCTDIDTSRETDTLKKNHYPKGRVKKVNQGPLVGGGV